MIARILALALCAAVPTAAAAQTDSADTYPNRSVRVVVPFPAGGTTDIFARIVAEKLQAKFGQPFVVENKPGASGIVGNTFVLNTPADGYTLVFGSNSSQVVSALLQTTPPYEPLKDFRPLSMLLDYPMLLLVNNDVPVKTARELVALAKERPGKLNMGSIGTASGGHMTIELFKSVTGINTIHIPYRGVPAAQVGLMAGETHFLFDSIPGSGALLEDKRLRGIAVTGRKRSEIRPEIPTLQEEGIAGFEDLSIWLGMMAPAKIPDAIAKKLEAELQAIARMPEVQERIRKSSANLIGGSGAQMLDVMKRETPVWAAIIKDNNIRVSN